MSVADIRILVVLSALIYGGLTAPPLRAATLSDELTAAKTMYYEGQVDAAVQALKPIADKAAGSVPSAQGKLALEYLLDTCVAGWDFRCVNDYWPKYDSLVNSLTDVPDSLKLPFALERSYYSGVAAWLSGNRSWAEAWIKNWPESVPEAPWAPRDYIRRQLLRAKIYILLEDHDAARLCLDRALASMASINNAESSLREATSWLYDAIGDLLLLGDNERAIGLNLTNARVGQHVFPPNSFEYFRLLRIGATAYEAAGMIPQAKDAIERALAVLSHEHLNPDVQNFVTADAVTMAALICILDNDLACARKHLDEHPLHAALSDIRARGVLKTLPEVSYLAVRALINAPIGQSTAEDLPLLTRPIEITSPLPLDLLDRVKMYQQIGHAITIMSANPNGGRAELRALAPEILRLETKTTDAVGFLPRRGTLDQLVLSLATSGFRGEILDSESGDIVVRLLDVATRNAQSYSSEALSLVATARNDDIRTDVRDLLRLRSRRESAERIDIARMLSTKPTVDPDGKLLQPAVDFNRRNIYTDYGKLIRRILIRLREEQPDLASADTPPSLKHLQESIGDNEAIVGAPVLLGNVVGHFCIRKDVVRFRTSTEDMPALARDIRLLEASLTSQNDPSAEIDRQYPVSAARHLYDTLLLPVEDCLRHGDSIEWIGPGPGNVPLATLLTSGTSAELQHKHLADWPWLAKEASVSQVATLSTLVALRRQSTGLVADRKPEFLGIGDPLFSGAPNSAHDIAQFALRGAVGIGSLSALPQLPDTRTEISGIAAFFQGRQEQLLGEQATEADFRRLPLERFTYLEFATHGLVRQDISGLTEPALALTPASSSDSFNDGLLTASEIADLPLKARFVALSACNSALVDFTKFASEAPGLSAAFQIAGVPATLGTLWPVESDASKQIVEETFRGLVTDKLGPAVALALAQRKYLANPPSEAHEHPRFWAPFMVFGDGTTPSEGHAAQESAQIGAIRLLTTTGGEVSSIIEESAGALLLRAMGDIRHGARHSSLTIKMRKDMSVEWIKEDPLIANSSIALRLDGGSLVSGYRGGGPIPTTATIQFVDDAGNIRQEWEVARADEDTNAASALRIGPQAALVAVVLHTRNADTKVLWPADRIVIAEIRVGHPLRIRTAFETISRFNPSFVGLGSLGNDLLVAVTSPSGDGPLKPYIDEFQQFTPCDDGTHSALTLLSRDTFAKIWEKPLPDLQVARLLNARDGSIWVVGNATPECGKGTHIGVWALSKDRSFSNLYSDQNSRDAQARGLFQKSDGSLLIFGISRRDTDVDSIDERDTQQILAKNTLPWGVSFSTRRINDAVIISLGPSLKQLSRQTVHAGSDIWVTGAIFAGEDMWLYGALGNQAALMQVTK